MPEILTTTRINAPIERCFDLSRSIDLHQFTSSRTHEKAVAGVTKGLINKGEWVTWRAKHFGIMQNLTSEISRMERPVLFEDRMLKGAFKSIQHVHLFEEVNGQTVMKDIFVFESPFGFIGRLFNALILTSYMRTFIYERNQTIKLVAESEEEWKKYISQ
ncbi:MAG TPA: SRPBCC family protein [Bacteroidia bacterium]|jgi:ligand-binding SRPBCC domain-containing protein